MTMGFMSGFFIVRFRKTQGAKLKPYFKTQGSKLKVFPENSMYRRFFNDFLGKNLILWQILFTKLKSYVEKLLYFDVKSIFVAKKKSIFTTQSYQFPLKT